MAAKTSDYNCYLDLDGTMQKPNISNKLNCTKGLFGSGRLEPDVLEPFLHLLCVGEPTLPRPHSQCQMFKYSRKRHRFDLTNLRKDTIWRIQDLTSNIQIFEFDRVKMPFTGGSIDAPHLSLRTPTVHARNEERVAAWKTKESQNACN